MSAPNKQSLTVSLPMDSNDRSYPIHIGTGLLCDREQWLAILGNRAVCVVTNETIATYFLEPLLNAILGDRQLTSIIIPDGEEHKHMATVSHVLTQALENKHERSTVFIALGGGVIGDITGFAAACFLRGADFVQVPTTLLAKVDSSVGGKTGVNHPMGKNLIGAFHQPRAVVIDLKTLDSLPDREYAAGIAEVIKYGLIADANFFNELIDQRYQLRARDPDVLRQVVARCCQIKADIVGRDEREAGIRAILNYGHTFGHAIEKVSGYGEWLHGEAVACGMVMATRLSILRGTIKQDTLDSLLAFLETFDLPSTPPAAMSLDDFLQAMSGDKKVIDGRIRFVVLQSLGDALTVDDVSRNDLSKVIEACR